jgi:hypothetical protein
MKNGARRYLMAVLGITVIVVGVSRSSRADERDYLYIGDGHDSVDTAIHSTIKRFDANTGKFLGIFIEPQQLFSGRASWLDFHLRKPPTGCQRESESRLCRRSFRIQKYGPNRSLLEGTLSSTRSTSLIPITRNLGPLDQRCSSAQEGVSTYPLAGPDR